MSTVDKYFDNGPYLHKSRLINSELKSINLSIYLLSFSNLSTGLPIILACISKSGKGIWDILFNISVFYPAIFYLSFYLFIYV